MRAVPNTPALVGAGLTALAWGEGIDQGQRDQVRQLFADVGEVLELAEAKLDAFLALTSSGPAFVALVAEAMADGAVAAGLPRDLALRLSHRTLAGTAELSCWTVAICTLPSSRTWSPPRGAPPSPVFALWNASACAPP